MRRKIIEAAFVQELMGSEYDIKMRPFTATEQCWHRKRVIENYSGFVGEVASESGNNTGDAVGQQAADMMTSCQRFDTS